MASLKEIYTNMLHLVVNNTFSYLNYLSVMSAIRISPVTIWVKEEPSNKYWDIVKKVKSITFKEIDPVTGITLDIDDFTGRTNIIYIGKLNRDTYVEDASIKHDGLYEVGGEFEAKDMCLITIFKEDVLTPEYVKTSGTLLAELIKRVLLKRVWDQ